MRCWGTRMTARESDIHTLPGMLTALRLPSFHKLWQKIAIRADTEGWPATRFLGVLAEFELAERDMRQIRRHLNEAQLPAGKTLATFGFKALPTLPRARVEALAAGDWLDGGGNLIAIGNSGTGKTQVSIAMPGLMPRGSQRSLGFDDVIVDRTRFPACREPGHSIGTNQAGSGSKTLRDPSIVS